MVFHPPFTWDSGVHIDWPAALISQEKRKPGLDLDRMSSGTGVEFESPFLSLDQSFKFLNPIQFNVIELCFIGRTVYESVLVNALAVC